MSSDDNRPLKELQLKDVHSDPAWLGGTLQFTARLYWKGEWVADVSNEGNGGDHTIFWKNKQAEAEINAALKRVPHERKRWPFALDDIKEFTETQDQWTLNVDYAIDYTLPQELYGT